MPPRKSRAKAAPKATISKAAKALAKASVKATATATKAAKAKETRARNKAAAERILRSYTPSDAGPSGTVSSNTAAELANARAGKAKEVVSKRHNHEPIPFAIKGYLDSRKPCVEHSLLVDFNDACRPRWDFWREYVEERIDLRIQMDQKQYPGRRRDPSTWKIEYGNRSNPDCQYVDSAGYQDFEEVLVNRKPPTAWVTIHIRYGVRFDPDRTPPPDAPNEKTTKASKSEKRAHLIDAAEELSTDSNSTDSQSDSHTRLSKPELIRHIRKKALRRLERSKAKKERAKLRARATVTSKQQSELELQVASLTGRHLWEYRIQQRWRCTRTVPECRNLHGTCFEYPPTLKHFVVGKTDLLFWVKEAMSNVLDGNVDNPPYTLLSKWTGNKNLGAENKRSNLGSTSSTTLDNTNTANSNYPPFHITVSPHFYNNTGTITGNSQLSAAYKQQEEEVDLPAHKQPDGVDFFDNSLNQAVLPLRPSTPIRPSSAIDKSVNSRELWDAFIKHYSNTIDKQYHSSFEQIISRCIEQEYHPEDFLVFDPEQRLELEISHGMWRRIRGEITPFRRQFKRDLGSINMERAASVLASIRGSVMLTTEEEDTLEDIEEEDTDMPESEGSGSRQRSLSRRVEEKLARGSPDYYPALRKLRRLRGLKESSLPTPTQVDGGVISSSPDQSDLEEDADQPATQMEHDNGEDY